MDGYHYFRRELDAMTDPAEAYRRQVLRGAHFTFNAEKFVRDVVAARSSGHGKFPSFDHAAKDPVEDDIEVQKDHRVVLVEGLYVALSIEPWYALSALASVFDETWLVSCDADAAAARLVARHVATGIGGDREMAEKRVHSNDGPNGRFLLSHLRPVDLEVPSVAAGESGGDDDGGEGC
ncbi:unnamed protein product [Phaeothamnion confervicola]